MKKIWLLGIPFLVVAISSLMVWHCVRLRNNLAAQQTVDAQVAIQPQMDEGTQEVIMAGRVPTADKFDANSYFKVLTALRPEDGCRLDWVYARRGHGGFPVLYMRKAGMVPHASFETYAATISKEDLENAWRGRCRQWYGKVKDLELIHADGSAVIQEEEKAIDPRASNALFWGYLEKIHVEDSPRGFFQFIVLRILGDRFLLFFHENYFNTTMVCSQQGWEALCRQERRVPLPAKGAALAFSPQVKMGKKLVELDVVVFCPFGGIYRHKFVVSRHYPHRIEEHTVTPELSYSPGFVM